jgi:hypothetical protein
MERVGAGEPVMTLEIHNIEKIINGGATVVPLTFSCLFCRFAASFYLNIQYNMSIQL